MSYNRVKILSIGIISIALIAFAGYSVSGGNKAQASHLTASEIPQFTEELNSANLTKSAAKRIIFKAHYLSRMMGTTSHSEFSNVADNWYYRLSREVDRLNESDRTVATSILAMLRTYEDMKTFRSMGLNNAKNFWPVLTTLTNFNHKHGNCVGFTAMSVKDQKDESLLSKFTSIFKQKNSSRAVGFTACSVKEQKNQSLLSKFFNTFSIKLGTDGYGFTSCTVKNHSK